MIIGISGYSSTEKEKVINLIKDLTPDKNWEVRNFEEIEKSYKRKANLHLFRYVKGYTNDRNFTNKDGKSLTSVQLMEYLNEVDFPNWIVNADDVIKCRTINNEYGLVITSDDNVKAILKKENLLSHVPHNYES